MNKWLRKKCPDLLEQCKEAIQQPAIGFKQWPQGIRHRECAVLARRIRQAGHHGGNPQVGGLFAAGRTSASVAALMDVTVVSAVGVLLQRNSRLPVSGVPQASIFVTTSISTGRSGYVSMMSAHALLR